MDTVKLDVKSAEEASRVELFIRIVWVFISYFILTLFCIILYICLPIQWLIILITGKRYGVLDGIIKKYWVYVTQILAYFLLLTDERNPLIPE